jgi:class 3 adenylate cyclase
MNPEKLVELTDRINAGVTLDAVLDHLFESFEGVIPYDRIGCAVVDEDGRTVRSVWNRSRVPAIGISRGYTAPLENSSLRTVLESGRPRILNDLVAYVRDHPNSESTRRMLGEGIRSSLTCPLTALGRTVGFLFFSSLRPHAYTAEHTGIFVQIAQRVSIIIEKGRLLQDLLSTNQALEKRVRFVEETFGRYVSRDVMRAVLDSPEGLVLAGAGEEREVTLLMSDLRGFSALMPRLPPHSVVELLNRFIYSMSEVIDEHHGTINEILGDCLFVLFGAPVGTEDHAYRAARCALVMQAAVEPLNRDLNAMGLPKVQIAIVVHTGTVIAGNIGCVKRAKYTVVGSTVNVVNRLEGCALGGQGLISDATANALGTEAVLLPSVPVHVKGLDGPLRAHSLIGLRDGPWLRNGAQQEHLIALKEAVPVSFRRVVGGEVGHTRYRGTVTRYGSHKAEIQSEGWGPRDHWSDSGARDTNFLVLERQDEVEISMDSDPEGPSAQATVTSTGEGKELCFQIIFTSLPARVRQILEDSMPGSAGSTSSR